MSQHYLLLAAKLPSHLKLEGHRPLLQGIDRRVGLQNLEYLARTRGKSESAVPTQECHSVPCPGRIQCTSIGYCLACRVNSECLVTLYPQTKPVFESEAQKSGRVRAEAVFLVGVFRPTHSTDSPLFLVTDLPFSHRPTVMNR